jgi:hypothetical protein
MGKLVILSILTLLTFQLQASKPKPADFDLAYFQNDWENFINDRQSIYYTIASYMVCYEENYCSLYADCPFCVGILTGTSASSINTLIKEGEGIINYLDYHRDEIEDEDYNYAVDFIKESIVELKGIRNNYYE